MTLDVYSSHSDSNLDAVAKSMSKLRGYSVLNPNSRLCSTNGRSILGAAVLWQRCHNLLATV